ncbi:hypothetical protein LSUE1_G002876 [Lachnellula suecica]|uniref:EthD domain-containing protein n=1 Tax=Lachnellula suecica TaxID=602035 RepID=A0A8T9CFK9_9HELO|nr:hypothetical protein LSUE1_G002876 [Lachnellula suecica]
MSTVVTLLYPVPAESAKPFDMEYYLGTHIPMVDKAWSNAGLKKWQVVKLDPKSGYDTQCTLVWENTEVFAKAMEDDAGKKILADIPNFSTVSAVRVWGSLVKEN